MYSLAIAVMMLGTTAAITPMNSKQLREAEAIEAEESNRLWMQSATIASKTSNRRTLQVYNDGAVNVPCYTHDPGTTLHVVCSVNRSTPSS